MSALSYIFEVLFHLFKISFYSGQFSILLQRMYPWEVAFNGVGEQYDTVHKLDWMNQGRQMTLVCHWPPSRVEPWMLVPAIARSQLAVSIEHFQRQLYENMSCILKLAWGTFHSHCQGWASLFREKGKCPLVMGFRKIYTEDISRILLPSCSVLSGMIRHRSKRCFSGNPVLSLVITVS